MDGPRRAGAAGKCPRLPGTEPNAPAAPKQPAGGRKASLPEPVPAPAGL
jgi:hypothetical protein